MTEQVLSVQDLQLGIANEHDMAIAVNRIAFSIAPGETCALLGESGCGKSLTAMAIMQLLPPAVQIINGSNIQFNQHNLATLPEVKLRQYRGHRVGIVFQEPMTSLNPVLTIGDQIAEAVKAHERLPSAALKQHVIELLNDVGIPDPQQRYNEYPYQLSGGMKQRVMIAIAIAGKPDLLIADEPTTALDVTIQAQILALLKQLQTKTGMAILLITHDLAIVNEVADRLMIMYAGKIVEQATCQAFFADPLHPYSKKLLAALPTIHKRDQPLATIAGQVPFPEPAKQGCYFADRCDYTQTICNTHTPRWLLPKEQHGVLCHRYDPRYQHFFTTKVAQKTTSKQTLSATKTEDVILQVHDLKIHFPIYKGLIKHVVGHVKAVDGVSFNLRRQQTLALVGESGCGKTTLGKGLLQLNPLSAGEVIFAGELVRQRMQIIFQDPFASMNPRMLVGDIISEGMRAHRIGKNAQERQQRIDTLLAQVGLPVSSKSRYPHEFSGGQRQRICIARALAVEPELIICDEPTSALDVSVQAQILNLLKRLQVELGLSYLFITHNLAVVAYLADSVAVMYLGRIVEYGNVNEILTMPKHPYTQALLAAVPKLDKKHSNKAKEDQRNITGELPSPINPPKGCHFAPRCPHVMEQCHKVYPRKTQLSDSHYVHCYLYTH